MSRNTRDHNADVLLAQFDHLHKRIEELESVTVSDAVRVAAAPRPLVHTTAVSPGIASPQNGTHTLQFFFPGLHLPTSARIISLMLSRHKPDKNTLDIMMNGKTITSVKTDKFISQPLNPCISFINEKDVLTFVMKCSEDDFGVLTLVIEHS